MCSFRLLAEETQMEQRALLAEKENRQQLERSLLSEVERLQRQVDIAKQSSEQAAQCGEELHREVCSVYILLSIPQPNFPKGLTCLIVL